MTQSNLQLDPAQRAAAALAQTRTARAASGSAGTAGAFRTALAQASRTERAPEGEKTEAVEGTDAYVDIIAGPRNGLYLNTSGNARDGETFSIVRRNGATYHVYGTGRDRDVVPVRRRETADESREVTPVEPPETAPADERTEAVAGHRYADIISGARNGMYLNTSGNARDGQAFVLVRRGEREYHIYGTGEDRLVVAMRRLPGDPDEGDGVSVRPRADEDSAASGAARGGNETSASTAVAPA